MYVHKSVSRKKRENFKHSYKPKMDKLWNENTNQFDGISF